MTRRIDMSKCCDWCGDQFKVNPSMLKAGRRCCSKKCSSRSLWSNPEYGKRMSDVHKGRIPSNIGLLVSMSKQSHGYREKNKGKIAWNKGIKMPEISGPNHYLWKRDRDSLKKQNERNDSAYKSWRMQVWMRDSFKCRIADVDCVGRIEAHHILGWKEYVELRYKINNGITLCHAHHPRRRAEEKRLAPVFLELVSVSKI